MSNIELPKYKGSGPGMAQSLRSGTPRHKQLAAELKDELTRAEDAMTEALAAQDRRDVTRARLAALGRTRRNPNA